MADAKLQALIDRVIGKKGILRAPSYWVRRLLLQILDHIEMAVQNVKIEIDSEMSDTSDNVVSNKAIKQYVDTRTTALTDEVKKLTSDVLDNEKVTAAALVDLDTKTKSIIARLDAAGI